MRFADRLVLFLATGCYVGYVPFAPGTFGSAAAVPMGYLLSRWQPLASAAAVVCFIALASWIADKAERRLGVTDPGCIVIDEVAGILVTFWAIPLNPAFAAAGFVIFRFFDILKPFPIRWVEARLSGGVGIVLDDVLAGVFANLVLRLATILFQPGV
jgi:phosphatidylglycerophosphatase A